VALTAQRRWIKRPMVDALTDDDGPREQIADLIYTGISHSVGQGLGLDPRIPPVVR
jgi:hypothetical protein